MGLRPINRVVRLVALATAATASLVACTDAGNSRTSSDKTSRRATETEVLGEQLARRSPISVAPYERQAFLEVALAPAVAVATRRSVINRWASDPRIQLSGDPTNEDFRRVASAVSRWNLITGLDMTVGSGPGDVEMHFVPRREFAGVLGVDEVDPTAVGLTRRRIDPKRPGTIVGATIVIADDDLQISRNRTIAHELGHGIGLQHSSCSSSLMDGSSNGDRSVRWTPTPLDNRMGALLYDDRLRPGLDVDEVAAVLVPDGSGGPACDPVDLELIRSADNGRHFLCARDPAPVRPCTGDLSQEPTLPITNPDAWTDSQSLSRRPPR